MNRKYVIAIIAILIIICAGAFALTNSNDTISNSINIDANALEDRENIVVDSEILDESNGNYHTDSADVNTVLIKNGGALKLANSIIDKSGDTATSGDDADFYGVNSAILVNTNGTLDISDVEINTDSKGSNGIFVTNAEASSSSSGDSSQGSGEGGQPPESGGNGGGESSQSSADGTTEATIKNVKITTHSDKSRGLDATYNGIINAENVIINTDGQSCAALATDRGECQKL